MPLGDTDCADCEVVESRLTSSGDEALTRTRNIVKNQDGSTVLVCRPLRADEAAAGVMSARG